MTALAQFHKMSSLIAGASPYIPQNLHRLIFHHYGRRVLEHVDVSLEVRATQPHLALGGSDATR